MRNITREARFIKKGTKIAVEVEGGWVSKEVEVDGLLLVSRNGYTIFLPAFVTHNSSYDSDLYLCRLVG